MKRKVQWGDGFTGCVFFLQFFRLPKIEQLTQSGLVKIILILILIIIIIQIRVPPII